MDAETIFMIASVSKTMTSAAVMSLAENGVIELDRPVSTYVPIDVVNPHHPDVVITVRMLLTHTSSVEDNWPVYDSLYTIDSGGGDSPLTLSALVIAYFQPGGCYYDAKANCSRHVPGTNYSYSNVGYALLGSVVEHASGMPFSEYCRRELFEPLEMDATAWFIGNLDASRVAMPHQVTRRGVHPYGHYGFATYPDGQLRTTVRDYARFLGELSAPGRVIGEGTRDEIFRVQDPATAPDQAIAWNYREFDNAIVERHIPRMPAHTGGDPGVATIVLFDPESGNAVIVFANGLYPSYRTARYLYLDMLKRLATEAELLSE